MSISSKDHPGRRAVAVSGVSMRFAGGIAGLSSLYTASANTVELHTLPPLPRFDVELVAGGGVSAAVTVATRFGTYVDSVHTFDASLFGLSSNEAALMDPQQRLLMEETLSAVTDSGR